MTSKHKVISRAEARSAGLTHYYTGRLCNRGHDSLRYTRGGTCIQCSQMPEFKVRQKIYDARPDRVQKRKEYAQSDIGKLVLKNYKRSEKGKLENLRYEHSEKGKASRKRYEGGVRKFKRIEEAYGLKKEDWENLLLAQELKCPICTKEFDFFNSDIKHRPAVDHNHDTGVVRGILCGGCNFLLGHARDDVSIIEKAISYLRKHGA